MLTKYSKLLSNWKKINNFNPSSELTLHFVAFMGAYFLFGKDKKILQTNLEKNFHNLST